jgi:polyisoprenoid-binding protein YceI
MPKTMRGMWTLMAVLTFGAGTMAAQASDWAIDKSHSEADFSVKHMGISTVHGSFRGVTGTIHFEAGNPTVWSVQATIDVNKVDTGVDERDKSLRGPDFFDVAKYPTMTFRSTSIKKAGSGYEVMGDLTLHGVTKPVTLAMEAPGIEQVGMDAMSVHRGFTATTKINRKDFGLKWNGTLKSGDAVIGDEVKIELNVEAIRQ